MVTLVASNHFDPGAYSDTTNLSHLFTDENPSAWANTTNFAEGFFLEWTLNATTGKEYGDIGYQTNSHEIQQFIRLLEGYNTSTPSYEDLTPSHCANLYNWDFLSTRRNLFLITNHTSNATFRNTLLELFDIAGDDYSRTPWLCPGPLGHQSECDRSWISSMAVNKHPWVLTLFTGEVVEVRGCKSEIVEERCKVQFSLGIMIAVICCNLVKACAMIMTIVGSQEPTLVTLGDAIDSFLRIPDPTTMGICFADRLFIDREWRRGRRTGPRQWKQKGGQRWWTNVSKTRWITCNFFFAITIIVSVVLLRSGIRNDGWYGMKTDIRSMWAPSPLLTLPSSTILTRLQKRWNRGFGKVNLYSQLNDQTIRFHNITQAILIANLPQTILSFLNLTYNSLFTCMLAGNEWSHFSHSHRTLRVTSPRPGQRSTYWLQIPYTYAIPLMILSGLLHWLTSQSLFFARLEVSYPFGTKTRVGISNVGYSCIAIIFVLTLCILALLAAAGMGFKRFSAEITTVSCCSAAISAACHTLGADSQEIIAKRVRWGDVGHVPNSGVRHLTFSSEEEIGKPVFGEVYSGTGEKKKE